MAYTQEQYEAAGKFIQENLNNPQLIASTASNLGISAEDLLRAAQTVAPNLTSGDVQSYFGNAGISNYSIEPPNPIGALSTVAAVQPTYTPQQYQEAGEWIRSNINDPYLIANTARNLGLSTDEILKAANTTANNQLTMGDVTGYFQNAGINYQPTASEFKIDAATVKPAANTYNGIPIPTFTDKYIDRGDESTQILSAADQLAIWKQNQDYLASLTPAQRAIQNAARTESQENALVTTYDPVTLGGKEWTVAGDGKTLIRLSDDQSGLAAKQTRYDVLDAATGQVAQQVGVEGPGLLKSFLTNPITGIALGLLLPGVGQAIGSALGATGAAAGALGSGVLNFGLQVAAGAEPIDALKGAVLSAGAGWAGSQISSMLPAELASAGKNAVTQLITTGKLDPAALATSVGTSFATDTLAAETGLDKATASKLVTAGIQAMSGNELAALTSLAQAGIQNSLAGTGATAQSPQDRATFLEANASPQGLSALSPIPAEDEQIAQQQRTNDANQALSDYLGPGNDLSREGLVSRLTAIVGADQAEVLAKEADKQILGADVMKRYSVMDPEFGVPVLDRNTAIDEMVAGGWDRTSASRMLDQVDAENVVKSQNRLEVQGAYRDLIAGRGSEEQLTRAMMVAGYTDKQIQDTILETRAVIEGQKLTPGEQAQQRAELLPDIRAEVAAKPTFNEAYALAREKLGAGASFTWQGGNYVASSAEERPDLVAATKAASTNVRDEPFIASNGMHNRAAFIQAGGDYQLGKVIVSADAGDVRGYST